MSDEYLFEKQGSDGEIEGLERLLSTYRIEPEVPSFSRAQISEDRKRELGWFRMGYVLALASLVIVFGSVVLSIRLLHRGETEVTSVRSVETPEIDQPFVAPITNDRAAVDLPSGVDTRPTTETKVRQQPVILSFRKTQRPAVNSIVAAAKTPRLTKEEKYAYDQLMVALWITGSKLKVVQDTINRVEDEKPASAK